jgi:hypothetical protein
MMDARLVSYLESIGADPQSLDGWNVEVAQKDGRDVGFFISCGMEAHMLAFEPGAMSRKNILAHLTPVFEQYGLVTTRVPLAEKDHKLRRMLGFMPVWSDHEYSYWAMTKLPFTRKEPSCQ